jgi:hydroxymethylbilane synthase
MQSQLVADMLEQRHSALHVQLQVIQTSGDQIVDKPLHEAGGKGLFTKELEVALLEKRIDFAVHSYKDVPVTMPLVDVGGLVVAATPQRQDPRDALATRTGAKRLADLPKGALVGTGSLRRMCQIMAARPEVRVEGLRGNIDTRLRKLVEGKYDAVILAMAGLNRTGLFDPQWMTPLEIDEMLPAPAQGALAIQCRRDDAPTIEYLKSLHHSPTQICVQAERKLVELLQGDCHSPIAALALLEGEAMELKAAVGARGGRPPVIRARARGRADQAGELVTCVHLALAAQNAVQLLHGGGGGMTR